MVALSPKTMKFQQGTVHQEQHRQAGYRAVGGRWEGGGLRPVRIYALAGFANVMKLLLYMSEGGGVETIYVFDLLVADCKKQAWFHQTRRNRTVIDICTGE